MLASVITYYKTKTFSKPKSRKDIDDESAERTGVPNIVVTTGDRYPYGDDVAVVDTYTVVKRTTTDVIEQTHGNNTPGQYFTQSATSAM